MLNTRAYSFRQQARLALSLCWVAGFVNAVTFLEGAKLFTSHLTGVVALGGIRAAEGDWGETFLLLEIFGAFLFGAMSSALLAELARRRGWQARYLLPIALEAVLLAVMCLLLELDLGVPRSVIGVAAFAMGLQNATITQVSGAVVRSTHLTGVVTDLGVESVQAWFWWRDPSRRVRPTSGWRLGSASSWPPRIARLVLLACILGSFLIGVTMGSLGHAAAPRVILLVPVLFLLLLVGISYRERIGEIRAMDPVGEADLRARGLELGGLPPGVGLYWLGRSHPVGAHPDYDGRHEAHYRAPDFEAWMGRLPSSTRDAVLVLSPHVVLDRNAALDLEHVVRRLREGGRRLWLASLSAGQRAQLEECGTLAVIGPERVFAEVGPALETLRRIATTETPETLRGL